MYCDALHNTNQLLVSKSAVLTFERSGLGQNTSPARAPVLLALTENLTTPRLRRTTGGRFAPWKAPKLNS